MVRYKVKKKVMRRVEKGEKKGKIPILTPYHKPYKIQDEILFYRREGCMKNTTKLIGIIALAAFMAFSMAACEDGNSESRSGKTDLEGTWSAGGGREVTFTGNTFTYRINGTTQYSGTFTISGSTITFNATGLGTANGTYALTEETLILSLPSVETVDGTYYKGTSVREEGIVWTAVTNNPFVFPDTIYAIAYGNEIFVAGGSFGKIAYSSNGIDWTAVSNSTFGDSYINAIAYGNETFVAGGRGGKIAYSSNGINWTAVADTAFDGGEIEAITYGSGKFVAVGGDGKIAYSEDGVTWEAVTSSTFGSSYIYTVAYNNGKFVAGGASGKIAFSTNGVNWTAVSNSTFGSIVNTITYGSGKFVAGSGNLDSVSKIAYSYNGETWYSVANSSFGASAIRTIAYGNGKFVAGGSGGYKTAFSYDGTSWTAITNSTLSEPDYEALTVNAIAYGDGKFVAVYSYQIAYWADGGNSGGSENEASPYLLTPNTWTNGDLTTSGAVLWYSFAVTAGETYYIWWNDSFSGNGTKTLDLKVDAKYGNSGSSIFTAGDSAWSYPRSFTASANDTVKLKVYPYFSGSTGTFAVAFTTASIRPGTSITWNPVDSPFGANTVNAVAYGSAVFVSGSSNGQIAYSSDGINWTSASSTFGSSAVNAIIYNSGKYLAAGAGGKIATSTNGSTWTAVTNTTFGANSVINALAYGNGKYVAGGTNGQMATSTDGAAWTPVPTANTSFGSTTINDITFSNGNFIAVGAGGKMATSPDGVNWTEVQLNSAFGSSDTISAVAAGNGNYVAGGTNGKMAFSSNGASWNTVTSPFDTDIYNIAYGNGKFTAVGGNGQMATSLDGLNWNLLPNNPFSGTDIRAIAFGDGKFVAGGGDSGGGGSGSAGQMAYWEDEDDSGGDELIGVNLAVPVVTINAAAKTVTWNAVPNASSYTLKIGSDEYEVNGTSYSLASLSDGMHEISVKTNGYETTTHSYKPSLYCATQAVQSCTIDNVVIYVEMVNVAGGSYSMGQNGDGSAGNVTPLHTATVGDYWIGKYEVTQEQYKAVMGSLPVALGSGAGYENYPVHYVSWYETLVFCNKLSIAAGLTPAYRIKSSTDPAAWGEVPTGNDAAWNAAEIVAGSTGYRLPTEAQWEYAAKGGNASPDSYLYAGSNTADYVAWYDKNSGSVTHAVGTKAPNSLGIYDMSGNVAEWCGDWYGNYTSAAQTDSAGASAGVDRVHRGGGCVNRDVEVRAVDRNRGYPRIQYVNLGFRLVRP